MRFGRLRNAPVKVLRSLQWVVCSLLCLSAILAVVVRTAGGADRFGFLHGHRPRFTGVFPIFQDGYVSKGFTDEYRIYSWAEDYDVVSARAVSESTKAGFKPGHRDALYQSWLRPGGGGILIVPERSLTRREFFNGTGLKTHRWVTVCSQEPIPDTCLSHLRYAFEPPGLLITAGGISNSQPGVGFSALSGEPEASRTRHFLARRTLETVTLVRNPASLTPTAQIPATHQTVASAPFRGSRNACLRCRMN